MNPLHVSMDTGAAIVFAKKKGVRHVSVRFCDDDSFV